MNTLELQKNVIHVWQAELNPLEPSIEYLRSLLSETEKTRADRFQFEQHRRRFIAGKGHLRLLLSRYLHQPPQAINFHYGVHGKPELAVQNPAKPLFFNSSDSHELALFAVCQEESVGIDIEFMRSDVEVLEIAQRFFSPYEYQLLENQPTDQQFAIFFKIWTLKEAFIKAIGMGLNFPLTDFDVDPTAGKPHLAAIRHGDMQASDWELRNFYPESNYIAALAIKGNIGKVIYQQFSF